MFLFCLVFAIFCACLFICALWSPAGKGLTSWLSFVVSTVSLSLSHWYPGSGVVLDCIDSWSLHHYLLLKLKDTMWIWWTKINQNPSIFGRLFVIKWRNWTWWESYPNNGISDETKIAVMVWLQCDWRLYKRPAMADRNQGEGTRLGPRPVNVFSIDLHYSF